MGDRALIQLKTASEFSPVLYLHWSGGHVADILARTEKQMRGRAGDVSYSFARLVAQAINGDKSNLSYGVWNADKVLTAEDSHGDAGVFVVDVSSEAWTVAAGGGYGLQGEHDFKVSKLAAA